MGPRPMNRVKVLHLRSSARFVGLERLILKLIEPLRREGYDIELMAIYRRKESMPPVHPLVEEARKRGIEAEQVEDRGKFSPAIISHIAHKLRKGRFSLLHTHDYKTDLLGLVAARLARVRCVATVHGYVFLSYRLRVYRLLDLFALRFFSKVIVVSEDLRRQLLVAMLSEAKVVTAHNAIDLAAFASQGVQSSQKLPRRLSIGQDHSVVSIIGRLIPGKGHRCFLESAKRVLQVRPEAKFLIVGEGPLRKELKTLAVSLGVERAVSFLDFRKDVAALMRASDVIVLSSEREAFGMVILEALALARPVVATRVGGVEEIIKDGESGLLVPPRDPASLAEAILYVLSNPHEAAALGERGQEVVAREFTVETLARRVAEVYQGVLAQEG